TQFINSVFVYKTGANAGKILGVGTRQLSSTNYLPILVRLTSSGALDTTFGTGGIVSLDVSTGRDWGNSVDVLPDDRIMIGGTATGVTGYDTFVARFTANGTPDTP